MTLSVAQKYWEVRNPNPALQQELCDALNIHPVIAQLLINRGVVTKQEAEAFLYADLSKLHDPFLLTDMDKAVQRIRKAQKNKERVFIFGDYDVDGVTSSALLHTVLKEMGLAVVNHIPHRLNDGYGLNGNVAELAKKENATLLITVDCGITASAEVDLLNQNGIDVIILDHHEPPESGIPAALAVIDPKRKDCPYPFKELAAVGLVAKLTQALSGKVLEEHLDLVALGTIADVVQLRGENRIFVNAGLPRLSDTKNKGLAALIDVAKIKGKKFRPYYVGFILGPRINATGRMDSARTSLDLLLCQNREDAYQLAQAMENLNSHRQKLQGSVIQEAFSIIDREVNFNDHKVIILSKEGWHKGVLGIVASRVAETYYRPTIVISVKDGVGTASARSIKGFHLNEALAHCAHVLEEYGGHKLAAGLTIKEENIGQFRKLMNEFATNILQIRDLVPTERIDAEIPLSSLSLDLISKIDLLEPYGEGNPEPVFCSRNLTVMGPPAVLGKETLKFWVSDGETTISAVGFGKAKYRDLIGPGQKIDLAYQLTIDDWKKAPTVQLKIKDIRISQD